MLNYLLNIFYNQINNTNNHMRRADMYQNGHQPSKWIDHNIEINSLPSSCEKDLRVSYLEQYELNGNGKPKINRYEINREQSISTLKEITDKYGFYWDPKGKLMKNKPENIINDFKQTQHKKTVAQIKQKQNQQIKFDRLKQKYQPPQDLKLRGKDKQNYNCQDQSILAPDDSMCLKEQIESIDQKIDQIVSKYEAGSKKKLVSYCKCKCEGPAVIEEQEGDQSPHFGLQHNSILMYRSKSTNNIRRPKVRSSVQYNQISTNQNSTQNKKQSVVNICRKYNNKSIESGKNAQIDSQIEQINIKIKQFEKEKEKLDINFKRFDVRQKLRTPDNKSTAVLKTEVSRQKLENYAKPQIQTAQPKQNTDKPFSSKSQRLQSKLASLQKSNNVLKQVQAKPVVQEGKPVNKYQQYVASMQSKNNSKKIEKSNIVTKFCKQIDLDQEFRNSKLWFQNNDDPHKWGILADKLSTLHGTQLKYRELVDKFSCQSEEHNPFFSAKDSHENYSSLLKNYKQNEEHWKAHIQNKFQMEELVREQFNVKELDVEQKGYIKVQDFVRYINMRTKNFYRTRDLVLLFQRFAGKEKKQVHFSRILEVLLSQQ